MKRLFAICALALGMAACQPAPIIPPTEAEAPRFNTLPPIHIKAKELRIAKEFTSSFKTPYVEHLFPVPPVQAIGVWADDRLKPSGNGGVLELVITDASVKEIMLPVDEGVKGLFKREQAQRYDARIATKLRMFDGVQRMAAAEAEVEITLSKSIREDADVYDREQLFNEMLAELMTRYNAQMEQQIQMHLTPYIGLTR